MVTPGNTEDIYKTAKKKVEQFSASPMVNDNLVHVQTTGSLSLLIMHISALKVFFENSASEYFYPNIILISVCIVILVIVGILTLYINKYDLTSHESELLLSGKMCAFCGRKITVCAGVDVKIADVSRALAQVWDGSDLFSVISAIDERNTLHTNIAKVAMVRTEYEKSNDIILEKQIENKENLCCCCKRVDPSYEEIVTGWYNIWTKIKTKSNTILIENEDMRSAKLSKLRSFKRNIDVCKTELETKDLKNDNTALRERKTLIQKFREDFFELSSDVNGDHLFRNDKATSGNLKDIKSKYDNALKDPQNAEILTELIDSVKRLAKTVDGIIAKGNERMIMTKIEAHVAELTDINPEEQGILENKSRREECKSRLQKMGLTITQTKEAKRIMEEQGDVLEGAFSIIHQERVFETKSQYQRMINYLSCLVFIINAFIAGLGLAENSIEASNRFNFEFKSSP